MWPPLFPFDPLTLALLAAAAFGAGVVDSVAGGGGLITVPALLAAGLPPAQALATNKLQASFGSGTALWRYGRAGLVQSADRVPTVVWTSLGAVAGTLSVHNVPGAWLTVLIPPALAAVLVWLLVQPRWGEDPKPARWRRGPFFLVAGLALGFYDGFLGPGTGTFWTVALIGGLGLGLSQATAQTKMANFTSNVVSLAVFAALGQVLWLVGLVMGLFQAWGARLGSGQALKRGAPFIRALFLAVTLATLIKVLWTALAASR